MILKPIFLLAWLPGLCLTVPSQSTSSSKTSGQNSMKKANTTKHTIVLPPEKAAPLIVPRFDKPPVIDGKIDDDAWKQAAVFKDFYQVNPGDNISPSKPTEAFIGYDS